MRHNTLKSDKYCHRAERTTYGNISCGIASLDGLIKIKLVVSSGSLWQEQRRFQLRQFRNLGTDKI